ncbi:MAG: flavodoxin-dependent (E)-4-hydroxy-3-methylbut-2-enyl-diphosphate synthase [Ruminococcaceae bacterium]|nr:flavodoxin-dependent (E)-4-hydroxy-3-methylbut-2-enyl-diphosphate synthase [Oscillospiraceae bacterium]
MNYNEIRRKTKKIAVGDIYIGGDSHIAIQSMTNTDTHDKDATLRQVRSLVAKGCDIVRITVPDIEAADTIVHLKNMGVTVPIVADIHFDHRVAVRCAEVGVDKIRINPGNIGSDDRVHEVVRACQAHCVPIRIGVNAGSLEKSILAKHGSPTAEALCESAQYHMSLLERFDFENIVVSIKASDPLRMIQANRMLSQMCDYPLHLGVTEAGSREIGSIKSAIGIGSLLCDGIGDTIRVSLTDKPEEEAQAATNILRSLGIEGQCGMNIVSCPTCGRTKIDLISLVQEFETAARREKLMSLPIKVALMGCIVNGPGEAREADIGIAGGKGEAVLIRKGEIVHKIPEDAIVASLIEEIKLMYADKLS